MSAQTDKWDRDLELAVVVLQNTPMDEREDTIHELRLGMGLVSRFYRKDRRLWNWFLDTEYTSRFLPPWIKALVILFVGFIIGYAVIVGLVVGWVAS